MKPRNGKADSFDCKNPLNTDQEIYDYYFIIMKKLVAQISSINNALSWRNIQFIRKYIFIS